MATYTNPKDLLVRINFYATQEHLRKLRELATYRQTTLSEQIRLALHAYLEKQK